MKRYALFALLLLSPLLLRAQQISGQVLCINTDSVVTNASVYFSGSVKGTSTNNMGFFTLSTTQNKIPLVISCIGYYSAVVNDYSFDKPITVYLKPKTNVMREVMIGFDGMLREEKMRIFKREFIGISDYALSCTIINPDDIDLNYDKKNQTLTAFCNNPIIIKNQKLGYTLNYYLDNFTRTNGHVKFAGNYLFKEDPITDPKQLKRIKSNRDNAYSGSRMQFIRSLWSNRLIKAGFEISDNNYKDLPADSVIFISPSSEKYISIDRPVVITYKYDYRHLSHLYKKEALSFIDKNGFYGTGLSWSGKMSGQRIGDMLPFEYVSPQDK